MDMYHPGRPHSAFGAGRQRGATFSGSFSPYGEHFAGAGSLYNFSHGSIPASAVPAHFALHHTQSPLDSPIAKSPLITASPNQLMGDSGYFGEIPHKAGLGMSDVLMEDVTTPTPALPPQLSRRPSYQDASSSTHALDMSGMDKLNLLDA